MKKIITVITAIAIMISTMVFTSAAGDPTKVVMLVGNPVMTINGTEREIDPGKGTSPTIINGRTLIPVRALIEALGGTVGWDESARKVTLTLNGSVITLTLDSATATLNGKESVLDTAPVEIDDRTMLPIRFIAESFGFAVGWDADEQKITISQSNTPTSGEETEKEIAFSSEMQTVTEGLSAIEYDGDYKLNEFLAQGGVSSEFELIDFMKKKLVGDAGEVAYNNTEYGCSTISAPSDEGHIFGRNFDLDECGTLVIKTRPTEGYASVSCVDTDLIPLVYGSGYTSLADKLRALTAIYAPLDGMNEKGLCAAVLMINDSEQTEQKTDKTDITTTTAIRLMLDKAATTDEAVALLKNYDMHVDLGFAMHLAVADATGKSVVIEYINNEMVVSETPVVTNSYLSAGDKYGIGNSDSLTRYDILKKALAENKTFDTEKVKSALMSVSKKSMGNERATAWSIVCDQANKKTHLYFRENYDTGYVFSVK